MDVASGVAESVTDRFMNSYLAEESWVTRLHGASVLHGVIIPGENGTITVRANDPEVID